MLAKVVEAHLGFNWNLKKLSKELLAKTQQWPLLCRTTVGDYVQHGITKCKQLG
jgi:hypothetical protein